MTFVPIANTLKVAVEFTLAGQVVVITFAAKGATAPTPTTMATLGDNIRDWAASVLMPQLSSALTFTGVTLTDETTSSGPVVHVPQPGSPVVGSITGGCAPNNVAKAFTLNTGNRGRSYRGRVYIPGIPDSRFNVDNTVTSGFQTAILSGLVDLAGRLVSDAFVMAVASRFAGGAPRVTGVATPVTGFAGDTILDSQRRRLPGRGT